MTAITFWSFSADDYATTTPRTRMDYHYKPITCAISDLLAGDVCMNVMPNISAMSAPKADIG